MGVRRQAREAAVQGLYMCDFLDRWEDEVVDSCFSHFEIEEQALEYAHDLIAGTMDKLSEVDAAITGASEHWSISRMGRVDRAILRIGAYELMFVDEVPLSVAINEAIEVAKRFSNNESATFINGVLDQIASKERDAKPSDAATQDKEESLEDAEDSEDIGADTLV